ncbi:bifunctional hydroxymethylpyrimidine kinase/phosphomethylpyrimidine kinase [candidate division KSB1 bacterium]|nr:bifunctional hydroxymethylpyrimidine kinase/phosphomethylpyrimidine kinase [candidate division KSB1 bacterium]RQW01508.1 MAG: bifunctional hydroxymethylpyrimidine kinase/phosphomethylpyrimidine kinase [candidate division KSB1 bacterium]
MPKHHYFRTLTIAGSDSSGGAGIQADLKTFSALGCYGMSVITALTAQNTVAVTAIVEMPAPFVAKQIDAVLDDIGVDAVKIGMLSSAEIIVTVAERLRAHAVARIVLDPVMVAKSGDKLLRDDAISALKDELLPLATIITPNIPEAEELSGRQIRSATDMEDVAGLLADCGPAVLVKGGHFTGDASDDCLLLRENGKRQIHWLAGRRIASSNTHGTGCTLSAAIAAHLAKNGSILQAVKGAKKYISAAILAGAPYKLGHGHGPVHHFFNFWQE